MLSTPSGTWFAAITLETLDPGVGHEVLAYGMETLASGSLEIDVWDNNFPGEHYAILSASG
jgi:hypothetical protein